MPLQFQINGQPCMAECSAGTSLLSLLRQQNCMGVHRVCETGDCGSCTVWVDGTPIHSCIYPAQRINGSTVTTIEGLAQTEPLTGMQQAFLDQQGFQCGYCTPGMIMTAEALEVASEADLRHALDGNLCRCTGYEAIVKSILAGKRMKDEGGRMEGKDEGAPQVGQNIPKQDGPDIVTGKPIYTADWAPAGLLHLKVLRSPHPHARIRHIDTSRAKALPGVQVVFTHEDVPRWAYTTAGHSEPVPDPLDHYLLDNKVRFIGDRVAAVVADSIAIAEKACRLIEVDYEILPHVIDPIAAMGNRATEIYPSTPPLLYSSTPPLLYSSTPPLLHDEPDSSQIFDPQHNIAGEVHLEKGDVAAGFAEADFVIEHTYQLPAVQHVHLEPHVSISWLEEDETLVVRSSTQVPFHCQRLLSQLFNLPKDKVRVFKTHIGGGFGNKQEILTEDLCALATLRIGRPVQWQLTREEEFTATNSRHAVQIHLKVGVKQDGSLTAMEMSAIANTGAYGNHGTQVVFLTGAMPLGLYRCPNQRFLGRSVYTNTMPAGAFRGYGATQGFFAVECLMDEIADRLQIDPIALRRQHLITPREEVLLGASKDELLGADHHFHLVGSCGLEQAIEKAIQTLGHQPGTPPVVDGHLRRGVGFAIGMQGSGLAKIHAARVRMVLKPNGRYEMRTGAVDLGTGCETTLRQIAADALGATIDQMDIIAADTHHTPFDAGAYASATTYISGQAALLAARSLRLRLLEAASPLLQAPPDALEVVGQQVRRRDDPSQFIHLATLADKAGTAGIVLESEHEYAADHSTLTFAVMGVEVEVDTDTGRVTVLRCVQALDVGTAINPRICRGQAVGGTVMGLGYALREELLFDDRGRILNPSARTYRLPLAKDIPPLEVILVENTSDPYGPFGAKGAGEVVVNCTAPAVANAIAHATGIRLRQLPMTPERVWRALQERANDG